jgi:Cof subfamily protein (haloacid dehalogenase superfamily)
VIPLVLLDLDGTVIGSSGQVLSCVWNAVDRVREAGMRLAVCTGRPRVGVAKRVAERLGPSTPHIFQSGAMTAYADGEVVQLHALKEASTRALVAHARAHNLALELYTSNALYVERRTPLSEAHAAMIGATAIVRNLEDVAENEPVVRAQWVVPTEHEQQATDLELSGVQLSSAGSPALKGTLFISITAQGVSKGSAVRALVESQKLELKNVMAVGDSVGDLPMLEVVGHPVVTAEAPEVLRERFFSVGSADDCGVVEALERALALKTV